MATITTIRAVNLLRYQFAGETGYLIERTVNLRHIGQRNPTADQAAFMAAVNDLYIALTVAPDLKAIAERGNAAWRKVPLSKAMNDAWKAIYAEVSIDTQSGKVQA